jgi:hypothetical protein
MTWVLLTWFVLIGVWMLMARGRDQGVGPAASRPSERVLSAVERVLGVRVDRT